MSFKVISIGCKCWSCSVREDIIVARHSSIGGSSSRQGTPHRPTFTAPCAQHYTYFTAGHDPRASVHSTLYTALYTFHGRARPPEPTFTAPCAQHYTQLVARHAPQASMHSTPCTALSCALLLGKEFILT